MLRFPILRDGVNVNVPSFFSDSSRCWSDIGRSAEGACRRHCGTNAEIFECPRFLKWSITSLIPWHEKTLSFPWLQCTQQHTLVQGSQTRGPRATCGPRNYFVRPTAMSMNFKIFWIKTTCIIHFTRKNIIRLRPILTYIYGAFLLMHD